jgi:two-component system nitrate/nitrite response regulator NarL
VLIVDDHAGFRSSSRALLESEGYEVIGEAGDGASALVALEGLHPDVVLLDVQLPDVDGFAVAERIAASPNPAAVVLISSHSASAFGPRIAGAAALGFLSKAELSGDSLTRLLAG